MQKIVLLSSLAIQARSCVISANRTRRWGAAVESQRRMIGDSVGVQRIQPEMNLILS